MKKRIFIILILVLLIGGGLLYIGTLAPIITGYAAKNMASGIFVAGRTLESLEKEDLNFSFIKYNKNTVDYQKKEVTSRFLFWKSKAIYIEGFGCTLVRDFTEDEIKSRPYAIVAHENVNPDTVAWPVGNLLVDTVPQGIDVAKLNRALDVVFADTAPMKGTFAVAVAYKNQLIAERYRDDLSADNLFLSWSVAKSFTNTLVGILAREGKISAEQLAPVDAWKNDGRHDIKLINLLRMNSGLEWNEDYGSNSDVNRMLFKKGDMALFAAGKNASELPDVHWYYTSGGTNIVCWLIRDAIGNDADYYAFPRRELFNKIGMRSAVFEVDASGTFAGSSYLYASMRDYVRYGLLYLNDGNWLGEQILPQGWVNMTVTPAKGSDNGYGALFWLNKNKAYPDLPDDMYSCRGHDGQFIYIIPSKNLVVVRTGFSQKGSFNSKAFMKSIVEAVE
ncbi:MAG: beta-lactamase family protein [Prolixibacteraceae bacterium]|nr:beta-lactamase family protein [Prolixibacteraceae bacterium]